MADPQQADIGCFRVAERAISPGGTTKCGRWGLAILSITATVGTGYSIANATSIETPLPLAARKTKTTCTSTKFITSISGQRIALGTRRSVAATIIEGMGQTDVVFTAAVGTGKPVTDALAPEAPLSSVTWRGDTAQAFTGDRTGIGYNRIAGITGRA